MSKKTVAVRISGNEYKIRSSSDERSLQQLALYVDRAMQRVREGTGTTDSLDVAVLTCLNLAREILSLKEQVADGVSPDAIQSLIERVEDVLYPSSEQGDEDLVDIVLDDVGVADLDVVDPGAKLGESNELNESAQTLELPSAESRRERAPETLDDEARSTDNDLVPEARMAAGGRDRAS